MANEDAMPSPVEDLPFTYPEGVVPGEVNTSGRPIPKITIRANQQPVASTKLAQRFTIDPSQEYDPKPGERKETNPEGYPYYKDKGKFTLDPNEQYEPPPEPPPEKPWYDPENLKTGGEFTATQLAHGVGDVVDSAKLFGQFMNPVTGPALIQRGVEAITGAEPTKNVVRKMQDGILDIWDQYGSIPGEKLSDLFHEVTGMPKVEPDPESFKQQFAAGAIRAIPSVLSTPAGKAASILGITAGGVGKIGEMFAGEHPVIGNIAGQLLTVLGVPGLYGAGRFGAKLVKTLSDVRTQAGKEKQAALSLAEAAGKKPGDLAASIDPSEIVPGSQPTTAQAANSPNLQTATGVAAKDPHFAQTVQDRQAEQAAARKAYADTIAAGGDPNATRDFLETANTQAKRVVDDIEKHGAQQIEMELAKLGPGRSADDVGRVIRDAARDTAAAAEQEVKEAYRTVLGPGRKKTVGIDPGPAWRRMNRILKESFGPKSKQTAERKELEDIAEATKNMDENGQAYLLDYRDVNDLIVRSSAAAAAKDSNNARIAIQFKKILLDRMDASASETAKFIPPYGRTVEEEAETIAQRLPRLNELRDILNQGPLKRWAGSRKALEDKINEIEKEVKSYFGVEHELNPEEWARYQQARALRQQVSERFGQGAMEDVRRKGEQVGGTALTDSQVPGRFFHSRGTAKEDINQFYTALGGEENAKAELKEYAIGYLRAQMEKRPDGKLTPEMLQKFIKEHPALDHPEMADLKDQLTNIRNVQDAIKAAGEKATAKLEEYQKSAARYFISRHSPSLVDPDDAILQALKAKTGAMDFRILNGLVRGDPSGDALAGLRRGIIEDAMKNVDNPKAFDAWMKENRSKIAPIFDKDHLDTLDKIAQDLARGAGPKGAKGTGPLTLGKIIQDALGGRHEMFGKLPAWMGGKIIQGMFFNKTTAEIQDIFNELLMDPKRAKLLLEKATEDNASRITKVLRDMKMLPRVGGGLTTMGVSEAGQATKGEPPEGEPGADIGTGREALKKIQGIIADRFNNPPNERSVIGMLGNVYRAFTTPPPGAGDPDAEIRQAMTLAQSVVGGGMPFARGGAVGAAGGRVKIPTWMSPHEKYQEAVKQGVANSHRIAELSGLPREKVLDLLQRRAVASDALWGSVSHPLTDLYRRNVLAGGEAADITMKDLIRFAEDLPADKMQDVIRKLEPGSFQRFLNKVGIQAVIDSGAKGKKLLEAMFGKEPPKPPKPRAKPLGKPKTPPSGMPEPEL